jgi:truncated hemoglobin YjbI/quinol monooxygenase YgiN
VKPVVEYVRYQVAADRAAEFEAAYADAAAALKRSEQCVDYELTRCMDEPGVYVLRITWTSADDHMAGFRQGPMFPPFLAAIGPYVDDITEMRHYEPTPVRGLGGSVPSLYDWAGGDAALDGLTAAFYARVRRDDVVGPLFADMDDQHPRFVAMWLSEVLGGPARYTEERGGYPHMVEQHVGKAITEEQRRRWVNLLLDAADEVQLPSDPEFRAAFVGYVEWGTRLALGNSQPDAHPPPRAPVPHWGWGVAPPYVAG